MHSSISLDCGEGTGKVSKRATDVDHFCRDNRIRRQKIRIETMLTEYKVYNTAILFGVGC